MKSIKRKKCFICLILLLFVFASGVYGDPAKESNDLIIYDSPSRSANHIGSIGRGESAQILGRGDSFTEDGNDYVWVNVRMFDGREGWAIAMTGSRKPEEKINMDYLFVIERNASGITVTNHEQVLTGEEWKETSDPSTALAAFFASYLSGNDEWKSLVADDEFYGSKETLIAEMKEAYDELYGWVDTIRITIDPSKFQYNADGSAFYTINIKCSKADQYESGDDEVRIISDENGNWFVVELPM